MLAGEYAVLQGSSCIACTVDRWLQVDVVAEPLGSGFTIHSDLWPEALNGDHLPPLLVQEEPLLQLIAMVRKQIPSLTDLSLQVQSQLQVSHGLGSSTAVRLAALLALQLFHQAAADHSKSERSASGASDLLWSCAREVWQLQLAQQGFASGYDVVTQSAGGLIKWQASTAPWPGPIERLPPPFSARDLSSWVHVWVGGRGAPTATVGGRTRRWLQAEGLNETLIDRSDALVQAIWSQCAAPSPDHWTQLCAAVQAHRDIFTRSPAYPTSILEALATLPGFDQTWTFKTTGAGGEDALILFGPREALTSAFQSLEALGWQELDALFIDTGAAWERDYP